MVDNKTQTYKIVAKLDNLAVHSSGYYGDDGKRRAQERINNGDCGKYWSDKEQAKAGFIVIPDTNKRNKL